MSLVGSVTEWIIDLKAGHEDAPQKLWERYFDRLVTLAWSMLQDAPRAAADEEDVALDAFTCFCQAALFGRYPQLRDRNDLWKVLVLITKHKAIDWARHERRHKRMGVRTSGNLDRIISREPTPAWAAAVADEYRRLLARLPSELREVAVKKMEGYNTEELARLFNCATRSIERKLREIRRIWVTTATN